MKRFNIDHIRDVNESLMCVFKYPISVYQLFLLVSVPFFLFICWIIYLANTGQSNLFFEISGFIPAGDKIGHLVLYGLLALIGNVVTKFKKIKIGKYELFAGSILVFVFVLMEEGSQYFIPKRTCDVYDLLADMIGIFLFTVLSSKIIKKLIDDEKSHVYVE